MPTYVALLRAINLGARRKFPAADVVAAVEAAGGTDVATYLNTGNVRLNSRQRSTGTVTRTLEEVFARDRGFAVPTVVLTTAELREVVEQADEVARAVAEESGPVGTHTVSLLHAHPGAEAAAALEEAGAGPADGGVVRVRGRGAHLLLAPGQDQRGARVDNALVERYVGTATNRNVRVLRTLRERWC